MTPARVRFAPSPTGYLHIGGARTALYNWLWAKKTGGQFVLRIEDTDRERSTQQSVQAIFDSMRWLGLTWDEGPNVGGPNGPYFQTERLAIYRDYANRLIEKGAAYRCYCTKEDLDRARAEHKAKTGSEHGFRYPGTCRERRDGNENDKHVVRLAVPRGGVTGWDDRIKGRIEMRNDSLQDAVLIRGDGVPLYNLGAAVDDIEMGITLVARGDDHVINTPQQILIYQALGVQLPEFAHLPMILAPSGEKLSKRHAAVSVMDYKEQGFLPDGLLNYLARLGWSHGDDELFTRAELIEKFDWEHCGQTGARYDLKKFQSVQAHHLRLLSPQALAEGVVPFLTQRNQLSVAADDPRLLAAAPLVQPRATTFLDAADALDYFFREPPVMDQKAKAKFLTEENRALLAELAAVLEPVASFTREPLEAATKSWLESRPTDPKKELKDVAQPARVALTGRTASPGLFEVMEVLGRTVTLTRLRAT